MHRVGRNYFQRLRFLPRRLKIAGPAQQAVQFVGRDHGQPDQHGAIAAIMVVVEEDVRRRRDQQFLGLKGAPHRQHLGVGKVRFILEPRRWYNRPSAKRVTVLDFPDGRLVIRYEGVDLPSCAPPPPD